MLDKCEDCQFSHYFNEYDSTGSKSDEDHHDSELSIELRLKKWNNFIKQTNRQTEPNNVEQLYDLVSGLLNTDPAKRLSAKDTLSHKWFVENNAHSEASDESKN